MAKGRARRRAAWPFGPEGPIRKFVSKVLPPTVLRLTVVRLLIGYVLIPLLAWWLIGMTWMRFIPVTSASAAAAASAEEQTHSGTAASAADQCVDEAVPLAGRARMPVALPVPGAQPELATGIQPQPDEHDAQTSNTTPDVVMEITDCRFLRKARALFGSDEVGNAACVNE